MRRALLILGVLTALFVAWLLAVWPPPLWYRTHWPRATAFMTRSYPVALSAKAVARGRLYRPVPLDSITPSMQDAVMIGEDDNFFSHGGVDFLALAHALGYRRDSFDWRDRRQRREMLAVLPSAWRKRDELRGASTITQQLAKNLYLSPSRNPLRKLKEAITAWRLESALGKRRIMELYLNTVELGEDVWGVDAASRLYFGHAAAQLTQDQAAALAGTLPFPLRSNPGDHPGRMRWRQNLILRRMHGEWVDVPKVEAGAAESSDTSAAAATPDSLSPNPADSTAVPPASESDSTPTPSAIDTVH